MYAATKISIAQLITVAPPVSYFKTRPLSAPITCAWILVQGEQDDVVSPEEVYNWVATIHPQPIIIRIPDAGHFFHGKLIDLRQQLEMLLNK